MPVVVVTGAKGRIGTPISHHFAAKGWTVFMIDRFFEEQSHPENCLPLACDLNNIEEIQSSIKKIGSIDALVNCIRYRSETQDGDDWNSALKAGLYTYYNSCQLICEHALAMKEPCSIINLSSVLSELISATQPLSYHVVKGAINQMTRYLAVKYGKYHIRANAISPGLVGPPATQESRYAQESQIINSVPLGRIGELEELAELAFFLASPQSAYITGQNIVFDGGLSIREQIGVLHDSFL